MSMHSEVQRDSEDILLRAMRRVLRPVARILLRQRIGFRQASELLKQVYVDAAEAEVGEASMSRLSLFTGIHRKEVKRLRGHPLESIEVPRSVAQGAPVLDTWTHDARFLDEAGRPRALARNRRASQEAGEPTFDELVRSVTSDVHTRTVLDEWLRLGLVVETSDGKIALTNAAFVPIEGLREKLFYFERNLHDHLGVAAANLESGKDPMFERSLQVSDLTPEAIRELEHIARREGMKALEVVSRRARTLRDAHGDVAHGEAGRINFGLYFHRPEWNRDDAAESADE